MRVPSGNVANKCGWTPKVKARQNWKQMLREASSTNAPSARVNIRNMCRNAQIIDNSKKKQESVRAHLFVFVLDFSASQSTEETTIDKSGRSKVIEPGGAKTGCLTPTHSTSHTRVCTRSGAAAGRRHAIAANPAASQLKIGSLRV